jgi:hypothetical protein
LNSFYVFSEIKMSLKFIKLSLQQQVTRIAYYSDLFVTPRNVTNTLVNILGGAGCIVRRDNEEQLQVVGLSKPDCPH